MWWKIYYENGGTFESSQGTPFDAPRVGVQVISLEDDFGKYHIFSQADYYYYEPERSSFGGWWFADFPGAVDHLQRAKQPLLFFGRIVKHEQFTGAERRALAELPGPKQDWRRAYPSHNNAEIDGEIVDG